MWALLMTKNVSERSSETLMVYDDLLQGNTHRHKDLLPLLFHIFLKWKKEKGRVIQIEVSVALSPFSYAVTPPF